MKTETDFIFFGFKITADGDCSNKIKTLVPWEKKLWQTQTVQRYYFADKGPSSQSSGFSSSHVWMWELEHKQGWTPKNWGFWAVVLEKTWESFGLLGDQTSQS